MFKSIIVLKQNKSKFKKLEYQKFTYYINNNQISYELLRPLRWLHVGMIFIDFKLNQ